MKSRSPDHRVDVAVRERAELPVWKGPEMPWYFYVFEFISGLLLTNGIPHFVQGVSGQWFQSPFAVPAG